MDQYLVLQYINHRSCILAQHGVEAQGEGADRVKKNNE
jgi:hypothetical protein